MNLRENQLSSRSVIPVALALPINRDSVKCEQSAREREYEFYLASEPERPRKGVVSFSL